MLYHRLGQASVTAEVMVGMQDFLPSSFSCVSTVNLCLCPKVSSNLASLGMKYLSEQLQDFINTGSDPIASWDRQPQWHSGPEDPPQLVVTIYDVIAPKATALSPATVLGRLPLSQCQVHLQAVLIHGTMEIHKIS